MAERWTVQVFFDGECPLCKREISLLRRLDRHHRVWFTDIAAPDFDATAYETTFQTLMDRIHGRLPDGTVIEGVEVFLRIYEAVGLGLLARLMRLPVIRPMLDWAYGHFARNRLRWTNRCTSESCPALPPATLTEATRA